MIKITPQVEVKVQVEKRQPNEQIRFRLRLRMRTRPYLTRLRENLQQQANLKIFWIKN
jgi:hypothetical protein